MRNDFIRRAVEISRDVLGRHAADVDAENRFPIESIDALREAGFIGFMLPPTLGGAGGSIRELAEIAAALGEECLSTALIWGMHCQQVAILADHASESLLPLLARIPSEGLLVASVTSEYGTGGDIWTSDSPLEPENGCLRVRRPAPFVSYGAEAGLYLIKMQAGKDRPPTDLSLVLVTPEDGLVGVAGDWIASGMRGTRSVPMRFDALVSLDRVVGDDYRSLAMQTMVPVGCVAWSAAWFGAARGALRKFVDLLRHPKTRGGRNLNSDLLKTRLARLRLSLDLSESILFNVIGKLEEESAEGCSACATNHNSFLILLNNMKIACSELSLSVVDQLMEIAGMRDGYLRSSSLGLERVLRDLRSASLMYHNDRLLTANGNMVLLENLRLTPQGDGWAERSVAPVASSSDPLGGAHNDQMHYGPYGEKVKQGDAVEWSEGRAVTETRFSGIDASPVVNSHNEWDPLEEVIVGVLDGAANAPWEIAVEAVTPVEHRELSRKFFMAHGGEAVPPEQLALARGELEEFVHILEAEGVRVRRPEPLDHARPHGAPGWVSTGGNCQANPRDTLIVFGDEILEAPMSWRSRYFEVFAYRKLIKEYFERGARWSAAPKPQLLRETYDFDWKPGETYVTTEFEPVFDAADIVRCGRDVFIQRSHVTNDMGIAWLRRHLGDAYRVHRVEFHDERAIHIDATFVPLGPGKFLVNPDRPIKQIPEVISKSGWDLLEAPPSTLAKAHPWYHSFRWLSMNLLLLDEQRVLVEKREEPLIRALRDWGLTPIPCEFRANYRFGGSFHCVTVDIRRRGHLDEYF